MPVRVALVDDHEVVRRGLRDLLDGEPGIEVVAEAGGVDEALARIAATSPDVVVVDVRLPDGDGVSLCRTLRERDPAPKCLVLTAFDDEHALVEAIMAGASGYLLKQVRGQDLVDAVREVAAGRSLLDPVTTARVLDRMRRSAQTDELAGADRAGAPGAGADGRGAHEPADRGAAVPRGEDGEELRDVGARQARHGAPHAGRRVDRPSPAEGLIAWPCRPTWRSR